MQPIRKVQHSTHFKKVSVRSINVYRPSYGPPSLVYASGIIMFRAVRVFFVLFLETRTCVHSSLSHAKSTSPCHNAAV